MPYIDDLRAHELALKERLEACESDTAYAQLSRQWLNVRRELEQLDGDGLDGLDDILGEIHAVR